MTNQFQNSEDLFKSIIHHPEILAQLSEEYQDDIDFIETFYIILGSEIKPYVSKEIYNRLKHREIIFKNKYCKKKQDYPKISLKSEEELLHDLLTDPATLDVLPTDEKYNDSLLEFMYIIWGDELKPYIPKEIYEQLVNEAKMNEYHLKHYQNYKELANNIQKKLTK